jgi:hypothetical protein
MHSLIKKIKTFLKIIFSKPNEKLSLLTMFWRKRSQSQNRNLKKSFFQSEKEADLNQKSVNSAV